MQAVREEVYDQSFDSLALPFFELWADVPARFYTIKFHKIPQGG